MPPEDMEARCRRIAGACGSPCLRHENAEHGASIDLVFEFVLDLALRRATDREADGAWVRGAKRPDLRAFVLGAADAHRVEARVRGEVGLEGAGAALALELGAVLAGQVVRDVGGG